MKEKNLTQRTQRSAEKGGDGWARIIIGDSESHHFYCCAKTHVKPACLSVYAFC
jgi:hypothetical protein